MEFESEEDEDDGAINAGGNKVGNGTVVFTRSISVFLGIGGLWMVSEAPEDERDRDQPILLLWIVVCHRCHNATLQTGAPEFGLESKHIVLGPLEVLSELEVDLQSLLARLDMFS